MDHDTFGTIMTLVFLATLMVIIVRGTVGC